MAEDIHPMNRQGNHGWITAGLLVVTIGTLPLLAQAGKSAGSAASAPSNLDVQVAPPPFTKGIFPCSQCHDGKTVKLNPNPRKLTDMHEDIVLKHGPESRWCLDCHDATDRDRLHLASGERIDFSHSYLLCAQCHGDKYHDWKVGVHGKRTGEWNGRKQYFLCVSCHIPHSPRFLSIKPLPPPNRPGTTHGGKTP